ncbi:MULTISPECIES: heme ABC transporter permease [unclassified Lentilitoribacter]|uniref:heme ABC transporter permease n=1 Tax=unclassified Lentilitoribacter TaxID=2647570 RepID=UPI0013A6B116|nr:heme ABC transporter permease [Lentilitoribacter sp. Alg239-R112]
MSWFSQLANPTRFLDLSSKVLPTLWVVAIITMMLGLYMAFSAPEDYQQGKTVQIMFIHVPAAWLSMMCYTIMAISSIGTLVWKHPLADVAAKAAAPLGASFTILALITGSLWGKPMWGAWWVWDARLTSVFVLLLMYLGLIALTRAMDDPSRSAKVTAIITIVGWINIPIIKFSVEWWNTLHQPASVIRLDGPTIHPSLLYPLLVMALAFTLLFFAIHIMAMRNEILRRRVRSMRRMAARAN